MKNLFIGLTAVVLVLIGFWYFAERGAQPVPMMQHEGMMMEGTELDMVQCPVTGEKMHKGMAVGKMEYKGKTYYFCCPSCIDEFKKNPEKFLKERKTKAGGKMKMKPMKHSEMKH